MFPLNTFFWILGTISISTSLVMVNKYIFNGSFVWPISLTTFHFFMTYFCLEVMCQLHLFPRAKHVPRLSRWLLGFYNVSSIVFMNFNLKMNSIGFYQLSKLCTIPVVVIYEFLFYQKTQPLKILLTLAILLIGLCLFTVNDVQFNLLGSIVAAIAVITTALCQSQNNIMQKQFEVGGPAMQHIVAVEQAVLALVAALALEIIAKNSILYHEFNTKEISLILLTGILAVGSNICAFAIIGKTSAVTYQVVGHVKTILIFVFGLIMFPPPSGETRAQFIKKICGLLISMCGVIMYTYFKLKMNSQPSVRPPLNELVEEKDVLEQDDGKEGHEFLAVESES